MPILDLQRRLREAGRIRIGVQAPIQGKPGKTRPAKLSTFRLTSQDETAVKAAAGLFGGIPQRWEGAPTGEQWEVITETSTMPVVVPPAATVFSQWYEAWSAGGCTRRCDGMTELLSEQPCLCATEDERTCTPHTRLNMILRDLPGIGVWRLETSGFYAATELAATVEVIAAAATRGQLLPAVLRLEERQVKRPGETVKRFAVPVLDIMMTPTALGLVVGQSAPPAPALPAGEAWQPIPQPELGPAPAEDVGDAIRHAGGPGRRRTKRSAPELPPTGVNPRGLADEPPPPPPPEDTAPAATMTDAQNKKLRTLYSSLGIKGSAEQKRVSAIVLGVAPFETHSALAPDVVSRLIDRLTAVEAGFLEFELDDQANVVGIRDAVPAPEGADHG